MRRVAETSQIPVASPPVRSHSRLTRSAGLRTALARIDRRSWFMPLVALVAAGIVLRILTMALYSTVVMDYYDGDALRYLRVGIPGGMFGDAWQPAGYPLFLAGIRG